MDLTSFLEKQRQAGDTNILSPAEEADDDDIDHSLAQLSFGKANSDANNKKGKAQSTVWDESLEELSREKAAADAARGNAPCAISVCHAELESLFRSQNPLQREDRKTKVPGGYRQKQCPTKFVTFFVESYHRMTDYNCRQTRRQGRRRSRSPNGYFAATEIRARSDGGLSG